MQRRGEAERQRRGEAERQRRQKRQRSQRRQMQRKQRQLLQLDPPPPACLTFLNQAKERILSS